MGEPDLDYEPDSFVGPLDRRAVKAFEKWLWASGYDRIRFDPVYLDYLARYHGGSPRKRYFDTEADTRHVVVRFLNFLPSGSGHRLEQYNVEATWGLVSDRMGLFLMPFAELFAGDLLCFDHEAGNPPRVVAWFHEQSRPGQWPYTEPVAGSFGEFLHLLHGPEADP
jgi:hypothetical protein